MTSFIWFWLSFFPGGLVKVSLFPLEKRFVDNILELLLLLLVCPSLFKLEVEGVEIREFVELAFLSEWFGRRAVDTAVGEISSGLSNQKEKHLDVGCDGGREVVKL